MGLFDFLTGRGKPSSAPPPTDRYNGRPLLILLESYVLGAIGSLSADKEELAASATQQVFGGDSDWRSTLRRTLQLGETLDDTLCQIWRSNQERAQQAGLTLTPEDFARMVTDENFAHLIEPTPN